MEIKIGERFQGYKILRELGKGGFGAVYYAEKENCSKKSPDSQVAIKILLPIHANDQNLVKRFHREARLAKKLSHPNVVKIFTHGEEQGINFIIMEYAYGKTLIEFLLDPSMDNHDISAENLISEDKTLSIDEDITISNNQKTIELTKTENISFSSKEDLMLPEQIAITLMKQCAAVLQSASEIGLIHRDIKPDNILLQKDSQNKVKVKILDFGLAKNFIDESMKLSMDGQIFGTPAYMSPEQFKGEMLDIRSDLFSLGSTFYTFLTKEKAFKGPNIKDYFKQVLKLPHKKAYLINPKISKSLSNIIDRLMEKDKTNRYLEPNELIEDLNRSLRKEPLLKNKSLKSQYTVIFLITILTVLISFIIFYYYTFQKNSLKPSEQKPTENLEIKKHTSPPPSLISKDKQIKKQKTITLQTKMEAIVKVKQPVVLPEKPVPLKKELETDKKTTFLTAEPVLEEEEKENPEEISGFTRGFTAGKIKTKETDRFKLLKNLNRSEPDT